MYVKNFCEICVLMNGDGKLFIMIVMNEDLERLERLKL